MPTGKIAKLYEPRKGGKVRCLACARKCAIGDGLTGFCGVRRNNGGKLFLEVYGRPCAVAIDPVEKKPFFHFLPGTTMLSMGTYGCNFACDFCQNWDTSQAPKEMGSAFGRRLAALEEIGPKEFASAAKQAGCSSVAFTYTEPAIFAEYAYDCAKEARKLGLKTAFVSNGYESAECLEFMRPVLDAINIDLKAFTEKFYQAHCKASLKPVLSTIKLARKLKIWTEVTTLVIPGENDSKKELESIAEFLAGVDRDTPWHVTAFHPDYKMANTPATPAKKLLEARKIGLDAGLRFVYAGNLPPEYSSLEYTYCPKCGELLVRREGFAVLGNVINGGKCHKCRYKIPGIFR